MGAGSFPTGTTVHKYALTISFPNTNSNQNDDKGKSLKAYVSVNSVDAVFTNVNVSTSTNYISTTFKSINQPIGYLLSTSNTTTPTSWNGSASSFTKNGDDTYSLPNIYESDGYYYLWLKDNAGNTFVSNQYYVSDYTCFPAGTKVLTDNSYVNIEDLKVGDTVMSETENGLETNKVLNVIHSQTDEYIHIYGDEFKLTATPKHEIYVEDKGYIRAYQLEVGDVLISANDERYPILKIEREHLSKPEQTYNLTVENAHNYFVTDFDLLVHNAGSVY